MSKNRQPGISTQSGEQAVEDKWLRDLEKELTKEAVQPKSVDTSLFEQINTIMNGKKSKYTSVAAAVEEMRQRSGLVAYLEKESQKEESHQTKIAQELPKADPNQPVIFTKNPQIKQTLENYVQDTKGNLPIPAILEKIRSIHQKDVSDQADWEDPKLIREISRLNLLAKSSNPNNFSNQSSLGRKEHLSEDDIDPSNVDSFHGLMPAT